MPIWERRQSKMGRRAGGNEIKPLLLETFSGTMETGPAAAARGDKFIRLST